MRSLTLGTRLSILFALLGAGAQVRAQTAPPSGWALNRYEAAPVGDGFFAAQHPRYGGGGVVPRVGILLDYAHNPLVVHQVNQDGSRANSVAVISSMLVGHIQAGVAFADRVNAYLSLPVSLFQDGSDGGPSGVRAASGIAVGDPRLGARVRLFGHADVDRISLHLGGDLYIPSSLLGSVNTENVTDETVRGRVYAVAAGRLGVVRWSVTGGYHARPSTASFAGTEVSSDLFASGGIGFVMADGRLTIGPEAFAAIPVGATGASAATGEALLGGRYELSDGLSVGVGGGLGLMDGLGTPSFRGLANLAYAPNGQRAARVASSGSVDTDHDGVLDEADLCVNIPSGDHADPSRTGCPLADSDSDGVYDNTDQCVRVAMGSNPDPSRAGCPLADSDSDGVFDADDACPAVAQGEHADAARRGCPEGDGDHDGVLDSADLCADVAAGDHPDPARAGCPSLDRDHDTVLDAVDHCPDQPGAPSSDAARNGCPGDVLVEGNTIRITEPVYFATGHARILPRSYPVLLSVAEVLRASPGIRRVSVDGHTDDFNSDESNLDLSRRRAASVVRFLVEHGIESSRLEGHGFGESQPVRPIAGLHGPAKRNARAMNRRVEFHILDVTGGAAPSPR